jgi:hypothetical protein
MPDDIDALFDAMSLAPPAGFSQRITAQAQATPQYHPPSPRLRPWQWASLSAGAGLGTLMLCQFAFFAFVAAGAQ